MRIFALGILALSVIYLSVFMYVRAGRAERFRQSGLTGTALNDRLATEMSRIGIWLAVWIYALPLAIAAGVIYVLNNG